METGFPTLFSSSPSFLKSGENNVEEKYPEVPLDIYVVII